MDLGPASGGHLSETRRLFMKTRRLGKQGLTVSELGLGCMGLSDSYSRSSVTDAQGISLIHRPLGLVVTILDTAKGNGPMTNERTVGKALQGRRDPEDEILPTVRELGIGFVPYSPLGRGFLAGRFHKLEDLAADDWRRESPRFQGENFAKNLAVLEQINLIAKEKDRTPSQLALAWLLAQGPDIAPIPGTTNPIRLEENLAAPQVTLSQNELQRIEAVAPLGVAAGQRYYPGTMHLPNACICFPIPSSPPISRLPHVALRAHI